MHKFQFFGFFKMDFPAEADRDLIDSFFWNNEVSDGLRQQMMDIQKHHSYNKRLWDEINRMRLELDETRKLLKTQESQMQLDYEEYEKELDILRTKLEDFSSEKLESRISLKLKQHQDALSLLRKKLTSQEISASDYASSVLQSLNH
ncbi:hypothetical protein SPOG_01484 [Schizosaccharomyces cryophilus OY26]|uniref:Uncharacterized protein n=1 Tax=Schizosaccharomyces cryophilus (strain OY26 / ATCC MYA-4695 / CBS 11777 / NBRC 106824 / NRRL Y48691) TaxID=653667 RepID=S9VNP6_SCHCR|nr:uncharacterized protein SPOG_01484 [Schizosaccharomyces cryophilus OY26]EPY49598.1 hypothetical protein SPOG_01484 [Schizosaccharomyces cryophilus OY26]